MKKVSKEVFWRKPTEVDGKKVKIRESLGFAESNHFETVEEAREVLTDTRLLERLNSQLLTDAMNEYRAEKRPGGVMGKTALRNKALERVAALGTDYLVKVVQDAATRGVSGVQAMEELVEAEIDKIKAELGIDDGDDD